MTTHVRPAFGKVLSLLRRNAFILAPLLLVTSCAPSGPSERTDSTESSLKTKARVSRYLVFERPSAIAAGAIDASGERIARRAKSLRAEHDALQPALASMGVEVVGDVVLVANVLHVIAPLDVLPRLAQLPGVARLEQPTELRPHLGVAVPLTGVPAVWESGLGIHGEGLRIGVIDTGIDYTHADFGGSGVPDDYAGDDHNLIEPGSFPTTVVVGGVDFAGDAFDASGVEGELTPTPDADPIDCNGHGTQVAGIAAGRGVLLDDSTYAGTYDATLDPAAFHVAPGVAPQASLHAIKIFGCVGSTNLVLEAIEYAVDPNGDDDPSDRLDVVNASLGSSFDDAVETELSAISAFTAAGGLFVAAQGNDGGLTRAHYSASFPASAPEALAVAASGKDGEVHTFLGATVTAPAGVAGTYAVSVADLGPQISELGTLAGEAVVTEPELACDPLVNDVAGKIALVRRGTCSFAVKTENAQAAGAIGIVIVDNAFADLPVDASSSSMAEIPAFLMRRAEGEPLIAAAPVTMSFTAGETVDVALGPDWIQEFSSRGPTVRGLLVKPDVSAPGADIHTAMMATGALGGDQTGTSVAAPMVAGMAALLRQARPSLTPLQVKALLTSTARPVVNGTNAPFPATLAGAGRAQADDALAANIIAHVEGSSGEVGVSFGVVVSSAPRTIARTVVVENLGDTAADLDVAVESALAWPGMDLAVSPTSLSVPANGATTFTLSWTVTPAELPAPPAYEPFTDVISLFPGAFLDAEDSPSELPLESSGVVRLSHAGGSSAAVVAFHGTARAGAERAVGSITGCKTSGQLVIEGATAAKTHATSVLELGSEEPTDASLPPAYDIVAVGALADASEERLFFAVVTAGPWTTPAEGWHSVPGVQLDVDGDEQADFMVLAESFLQQDGLDGFSISAPFARLFDMATGTASTIYEPLNAARAAYPGGAFFSSKYPETHATQPYFNNVVVFPVPRAALGDVATLRYRGVTGVSRAYTVTGLPPREPTDTSAWVTLGEPRIVLADTRYDSPLYPDADELGFSVVGDSAPTLLVLHHSNAEAPHHEIVAVDGLEESDLSLTGDGDGREARFSVANVGSSRAAVTLAVTLTGGTIEEVTSPTVDCDANGCTADVSANGGFDVTVRTSGAAELVVTGTVTSAQDCDTDPSNQVAQVMLAGATPAPPTTTEEDGCGCRLAPSRSPWGWGAWLSLAGLTFLRLRRRRGRSAA